MSILDRLSRLLRANVNDLISKAEDPGKIIEQALRDMRAAYAEARSEVADAMSQNAKLEREANTNRRMASEYEKKAEEALRGGSEDLAREALRRSQNAKDLAAGFEEQLQVQSGTVEQLKTQLRALEAKIDEMESKKSLLAARQKTAGRGDPGPRVGFRQGGRRHGRLRGDGTEGLRHGGPQPRHAGSAQGERLRRAAQGPGAHPGA